MFYLGAETYGRWSPHCLVLICSLVRNKVAGIPDVLRNSARQGYAARWWALLSVAALRTVATSVLRRSGADLQMAHGLAEPGLDQILV